MKSKCTTATEHQTSLDHAQLTQIQHLIVTSCTRWVWRVSVQQWPGNYSVV